MSADVVCIGGQYSMTADIISAAQRITDEHMRLQRAAEVRAHNAAIDKASEIISEWLTNGRDESTLFDKLQDARIWIA